VIVTIFFSQAKPGKNKTRENRKLIDIVVLSYHYRPELLLTMLLKSFAFLCLAIVSLPLYGQMAAGTIGIKDVITGVDTPWEILWGPDNFIWMTERYGRISRVDPANGELHPLITMPEVHETAECGLMGLALHPQFPDPPYVYCSYTAKTTDTTYGIHIARFTYAKDTLVDKQILIDPKRIIGGTIHEGCRLLIDSTDMTMYVTTGDADDFYGNPQVDSRYNGKVLRMNLDGSVPADNPIPGNHVWSKGHRNAQGLTFGPHHLMYETMHGTWEDDEINIIKKDGNYGWPFVDGWEDLADEKLFAKDSSTTEPIFTWTPTIAPAGCAYYDHEEFPFLRNCLLVAVLKGDGDGNSYMIAVHLDSSGTSVLDTVRYFYGQYGRFRDVCISPDGKIFVSTSNKDSKGSPKEGDDRIIMLYNENITSVREEKELTVSITPNPMTGSRSALNLPNLYVGSSYDIVDALGRIMRSGIIESEHTSIERGSLMSGMYLLRIHAKVPYLETIVVN
jgi:aldose sugar dehydrogenase